MTAIHTPRAGEVAAGSSSQPAPLQSDRESEPTEVLFPEAKRRERRRRLIVLAVIVVVLGATGIGYAASRGTAPPPRHTVQSPATEAPTVVATAVGGQLQHPYGLAVAPDGDLYIVDSGRDQVLRRLPSGKFQVVAGNGHRGFSGDGGPAVDAKLSLAYDSAIVVAQSGTVYFSDTSNGRVREVLPDGVIETVAGGGHEPAGQTMVPALDASFAGALTVVGLTIGPNGELYIGAGAVYRLAPNGLLHWVVGEQAPIPQTSGSIPPGQYDFTSPIRLAFDGKDDLLVAGGGAYGLYAMTPNGDLRYIANVRGDGQVGALAEGPGGKILVASREQGIAWLRPNGSFTPVAMSGGRAVATPLDVALGKNGHFAANYNDEYNVFIPGDGAAVGPNGAIYLDTNTGNTFTTVSGLVEVKPNGSVLALWKS